MDITKYELMLVSKISGSEGLLSRVEKVLKDAKAENLKVDKLGKKQLAYPIKKQTEADYCVLNFEVLGSEVKTLSDMLRLEQEDLLRHLLLTQKTRKPSKRKVSAKIVEEKIEENKPKVTVVTKKVEVTAAPKVKEVKSPKATKEKKPAKKVAKGKK